MKTIIYTVCFTLAIGLLAGCKEDEPAKPAVADTKQELSLIKNNKKSVPKVINWDRATMGAKK